ncbi:unnamed protein product [Rhizopus stolonifer]
MSTNCPHWLPSYPLQSTPSTVLSIAETIENSVGGTSSAFYCIFLNALASGLTEYADTCSPWQAAAHHAFQALMTYTKARVGDRILMDTLCPFITALDNRSLEEAVELAQLDASSTQTMSSHLGKSSYLSNQHPMYLMQELMDWQCY